MNQKHIIPYAHALPEWVMNEPKQSQALPGEIIRQGKYLMGLTILV